MLLNGLIHLEKETVVNPREILYAYTEDGRIIVKFRNRELGIYLDISFKEFLEKLATNPVVGGPYR